MNRFHYLSFFAALAAVSSGLLYYPQTPAYSQNTVILGAIKFEAATMEYTATRYTLSGGRPKVWTADGSLRIESDRIVIELTPRKKGQKAPADPFDKVTASGSVSVSAVSGERSGKINASTAVYHNAEQKVVFEGSVRAVVTDPELAIPSTITASRLTYWLKPGENQTRLKIEGEPASVTLTPKQPARSPAPASKSGN